MSENAKKIIDNILYAVLIIGVLLFAIGLIRDILVMCKFGIWLMLLGCPVYAAVQVWEYLSIFNDSEKKNKILLIKMIVSVVVALAVISLSIFILSGKIITLPTKV